MWNERSLFWKAREYLNRAHSLDSDSELFPFWVSLSLEFLARACLARIHPVLLADPQSEDSVMFAFGYAVSRDPKVRSITTQRVFQRCAVIIADFTEDELKFAVSMAERRNQELHSGASPFDGLSPDLWQAEFYRVCEVLLTFLEK